MKSIGTVSLFGDEYVVMIIYQKSVTYYFLLSKYHREDQEQLIFNGELKYPIRNVFAYSANRVDNNYIIAAISKKNIGGEMKAFGNYQLLLEVINATQSALSYSFRKQDILLDDSSKSDYELVLSRAFLDALTANNSLIREFAISLGDPNHSIIEILHQLIDNRDATLTELERDFIETTVKGAMEKARAEAIAEIRKKTEEEAREISTSGEEFKRIFELISNSPSKKTALDKAIKEAEEKAEDRTRNSFRLKANASLKADNLVLAHRLLNEPGISVDLLRKFLISKECNLQSLKYEGIPVREFVARDESVSVEYRKVGGYVVNLKYSSASIELNYREEDTYYYPNLKEISSLLVDLKTEQAGSYLYYSNVKTVDYETVLRNMVDSSWYVEKDENGQEIYHKQYLDISSKEEFERLVILGLVGEIKEARRTNSLPLLVSIDTETTGLHVYGVPKEFQSTIVAIPFSFKDDTGFVIYTDMEYFNNVPIEYVKERLEPFLNRDLLKDPELTIDTIEGPFTFKRSEIFNTGHNTMFDVKAFAVHDMKVWFDADTMQMSFNLDPFLTKRKNSLKYITHKMLKCWTPELSDVLGHGNEDKFRYITDPRIARLYGGSDGDFGRLSFKALRHVYKASETFHRLDLFQAYLDQDVIPMNMVAGFDYNGIRIDRNRFVKEGEIVKKDMEIISDFTHKYVGRMIAINNYLSARKRIIDSNIAFESTITVLEQENKDHPELIKARVQEIRGWMKDPDSIAKPDLNAVQLHKFKFAGDDLIKTLYEILHYPILAWTEPPKTKSDGTATKESKPRPAVNKAAMKKLMSVRARGTEGFLKADIPGANKKSLIVAKEFNKYKYPVAYLVSLLGPRKKEYDSYFAAFEKDSYGDRLCKDSKFASIDTRRISNPIQTIKGSLKKYMLPHSDAYAMCDFDMSQVELRIMASLAHDEYTIKKMRNPEVDSHTECASDMSIGVSKFHKAAYLITKWERSNAKQVNFGYPYGLQRRSMCERIFGDMTDEHLGQTQRIIEAFESARHKIVSFLDRVREQTLKHVGDSEEEPIPIPPELRKYLEIGDSVPVGVVRNLKGFYKLFQLDELDEKKRARIKRQSGNFPVQSFAAELFRIILIRLFKEFWTLGWIQNGWIKGHILVHDEFLFSFKKPEIHPIHLISVIHKCCTVNIEGHTTYYIGINIGDSWGECKDDMSELPVFCVQRLVRRWDAGEFLGERVDNPKEYIAKLRQQYISDRVWEVIKQMRPDASKDNINCGDILEKFENYTVRKYVYECFFPLWTPVKDEKGKVSENASFDTRLASWALDRFGDGTRFITSEKKEVFLYQDLRSLTRPVEDELVPFTFEEMFEGKLVDLDEFFKMIATSEEKKDEEEQDYYKEIDWDLDGTSNPYYIDYDTMPSLEDESFPDLFDEDAEGTLEQRRKIKPTTFKNMEFIRDKVTIIAYRRNHYQLIESALDKAGLREDENENGVRIWYQVDSSLIKGSSISKDHLPQLDEIVANVRR